MIPRQSKWSLGIKSVRPLEQWGCWFEFRSRHKDMVRFLVQVVVPDSFASHSSRSNLNPKRRNGLSISLLTREHCSTLFKILICRWGKTMSLNRGHQRTSLEFDDVKLCYNFERLFYILFFGSIPPEKQA